MKREKDFKRNFKNSGKIRRIFFAHKMFLNQENRNRKQKRVFPTFHDKKHSCFGIHQKGEKRETELKRRIKKKAGYKNEKLFFKTQKKTKHGKTWKNPREKETEKTKFFCCEKKKNSFAEV